MADYNITAVTRRVVYTGSAGVGPYAFTFPVISQTDLAVYKNSTKLTLTTNYTVTINGATGTGSVTLVVAATGADQIVIIGARAIERTTDFVTAGDLKASSLNEQLDASIILIQQLAEENKRTLKAPQYDPAAVEDGGILNMVLPTKVTRASKLLSFDTDGNPATTLSAGDISSAQSYATAAAASAASASSSATSAASSYDSFDDRYLGAYATNPTVDNDGNSLLTGALYFNTTSNEMRVWSGSAWVISYLSSSGFVLRSGDSMTGALGIGTATPDGDLEVSGTSTAQYITRYSTDTSAASLLFRKSRGTESARTTVVSGDNIADFNFSSYDGTGFTSAADIIVDSEGTIGTNRVPGRMLFRTGTDASPTVVTTAISINSSQVTNFTNGIQVNSINAYAMKTIRYLTGSGTYTTPSKVRAIYVECVGGGGGGGGVDGQGAGTAGAARSGGGGGYCAKFITSPAATYTYAIGAGGSGGAAGNNNATDGSNTTFVGTGTSLNANGGSGGGGALGVSGNSQSTPGGTGGNATGGDINLLGSRAGARSIVAGGIITAVSQSGEAPMFGGGYATVPDAAGANGVNFGSAGTGASTSGVTTNYAGGDGAAGTIRITEYY